MFENKYSKTQTQTLPSLFTGSSNALGSTTKFTTRTNSSTSSTNSNRNSSSNEIMFAVITSNLQEVKRLVNASNANDIIDTTNNYTSLHHAVRIRGNNSIIEYLMSIGADPKLKQGEGKDCIDLAIEANYRYLIDKLLKEKDMELDKIYDKYDTINYEYKNLQATNAILVEENEYLKKSSSQYVEKIETLKTENAGLKRKYDESEKAFANLLKKVKK
jgi:ankyrin repeat protein